MSAHSRNENMTKDGRIIICDWFNTPLLMPDGVVESILSRDVYVVVAIVMLSSVFLVAGNLLADLLLFASDPRIRME